MDSKLALEEKTPVRIVVVGGGVGGTLVANLIGRRLGGKAAVQLVTASPWHVYEPGLLFVPFYDMRQVDVIRPERDLLRPEVALVEDPAIRIDLPAKRIRMASGLDLAYDYLVIATGTEFAPHLLPGGEAAHHFFTLEAAERLHDALYRFTGGTILVGAAEVPHKHPQAMIEFALLCADHLERNGLDGRSEIVLFSPAERCFFEPKMAEIAERRFQERGIRFIPGFAPASVDPVEKTILSKGGDRLAYDLLVMAPPQRGVKLIRDSGIGDARGFLPTDPETLRLQGAQDVWVVGDCSDLEVSRVPSAANHQAHVVAEAVAADFLGVEPRRSLSAYDGSMQLFVEMGDRKVAFLDADYEHPASVVEPSRAIEAGKRAFDRAYWQLVPTGLT